MIFEQIAFFIMQFNEMASHFKNIEVESEFDDLKKLQNLTFR